MKFTIKEWTASSYFPLPFSLCPFPLLSPSYFALQPSSFFCPSHFIPRLDWKAPADGGAVTVTVYKLQRRQRPDGAWQDIGLAMETNTTLTAQERGKEWEYRVMAVNKAGEGAPQQHRHGRAVNMKR